jgi:predicted porin
MKKSLIALAALAAVTAASAQSSVTISGKFGTAFQQPLGTEASIKGKANIAVTDGDIGFAAVEDLGGGLKAGANMALRLRGRENVSAATTQVVTAATPPVVATAQAYSLSAYSEVGRDATVFLSGPFGTITAGAVEFGNGITGRGFGGTNSTLPTDLNNGGVLAANAYGNMLQYSSPAMSGLSVQLTRADSIGSIVGQKTLAASGRETALGLNANIIGFTYANGPLTANIDSTAFSGNTTHGSANSDRKRTRMSADYDFGFAKIGVGQEDNKGTATTGTYAGKQTAFGISAPITPALRVGVAYAKNTESAVIGVTTAGAAAKGTGISADYAFSKRTVLNVSYATIARDDLADNANHDKEGTQYRIRLMHSF